MGFWATLFGRKKSCDASSPAAAPLDGDSIEAMEESLRGKFRQAHAVNDAAARNAKRSTRKTEEKAREAGGDVVGVIKDIEGARPPEAGTQDRSGDVLADLMAAMNRGK